MLAVCLCRACTRLLVTQVDGALCGHTSFSWAAVRRALLHKEESQQYGIKVAAAMLLLAILLQHF